MVYSGTRDMGVARSGEEHGPLELMSCGFITHRLGLATSHLWALNYPG